MKGTMNQLIYYIIVYHGEQGGNMNGYQIKDGE